MTLLPLPKSQQNTIERNASIRNDARNGMNSLQLAAKYGLSQPHITNICKGAMPPRADVVAAQQRREGIREDYANGMTLAQIREKYGVGETTVRTALQGVERRHKGGRPQGSASHAYAPPKEKKKRPEPKPEPKKIERPPVVIESVHSPVKVYHISQLSPEEQERIMNLNDPYRTEKKPVGAFVPRHV
jgi:Mor family transcriptional regulator